MHFLNCIEKCITGEIRLGGGQNTREGRVEFCADGRWGSVCDSFWTATDAEVVCRQIGQYSSGMHNNLCYKTLRVS